MWVRGNSTSLLHPQKRTLGYDLALKIVAKLNPGFDLKITSKIYPGYENYTPNHTLGCVWWRVWLHWYTITRSYWQLTNQDTVN